MVRTVTMIVANTDRKWTLLQVFNQIKADTEGGLETVYKVVGERVRRYV